MGTEVTIRSQRLGPSRAEVLIHLRDGGTADPVAAIAAAVGLHENTVRFHLDALIEAGLVRREPEIRNHPGRPRVLYRAVPTPSQQPYQDLATAMVRHFAGPMVDHGGRAQAAGHAWGLELRAGRPDDAGSGLPGIVARLARLGYQPELVAGPPPSINFRPCPYSGLAGEDLATVCRLHLGLLQGLIEDDASWEVISLEPYVTPECCVARLGPKGETR